jgi:hypothetical protein
MKIEDFRLWRSPAVCWWSFALFSVVTFIVQVVDVIPYPDMERDWLILMIGGAASSLFLLLAIRATKQKKT